MLLVPRTAWPRKENVCDPNVGKSTWVWSVVWVKSRAGSAHAASAGNPEQSAVRDVLSECSTFASRFASTPPLDSAMPDPARNELMWPVLTRGFARFMYSTPFLPKKLHGDFGGTIEPVDQSRSTLPPTKGVNVNAPVVSVCVRRAVARSPRK